MVTSTRQTNGSANGQQLFNQEVHSVYISDEVRSAGQASSELLAEAITYLHRDGIIVLENAIDITHIDALQAMLGPEAEEVAKDPDHHFNFGKDTKNMDQAPPLIPELMFQDVWANPIACSVLKAMLGSDIRCHYANGNTALGPAEGRQPVHADIDKPHPLFPFGMVLNIPLCDVVPENGATEIWVGSHRGSNIDQHTTSGRGEQGLTIKPEIVEERREHSPPIYPSVKKGSMVIRDVRLWHAGVPNRTDRPRIMLAYVVEAKWFEAPAKVLLPLKVKDLIDQWKRDTGLEFHAKWIDGEVDHKKVKSDESDFATSNKKLLELESLMHLPVH